MFNKVYLSIFIKYFKLFLVTINFLERVCFLSFFLPSFLSSGACVDLMVDEVRGQQAPEQVLTC